MFVRILTLASLALASTAVLALETQSPIDWPPKAVAKQQKGKVPDFSEKNGLCLECHKTLMKGATGKKTVPNLHRLHLESKKVAYEGKNRDCLTCHEMVTPSETDDADKKEGWFVKGDVYHPNWLQNPRDYWKKLVVRGGEGKVYTSVDTLRPQEPYGI